MSVTYIEVHAFPFRDLWGNQWSHGAADGQERKTVSGVRSLAVPETLASEAVTSHT